jgi:hypothetical protein
MMHPDEYKKAIDEMLDESKELIVGFQALFDDTPTGELKYLFTLHCMIAEVCFARGIPQESFHALVPNLVAVWHASGKPDNFQFGAILAKEDQEPTN